MWVVNPWVAILVSLLIFIMIGFIATYYFLKRLLGLGSLASILGAVFFIANGFYFEHAAVGHITYQAFPLFAVIVMIFTHPRLPTWLGGVFLSLVITILVYSGIQNIAFFPLISIIFFPLLYLIKPSLIELEKDIFDRTTGRNFGRLAMRFEDLRHLFFYAIFSQIDPG